MKNIPPHVGQMICEKFAKASILCKKKLEKIMKNYPCIITKSRAKVGVNAFCFNDKMIKLVGHDTDKFVS